MTAKRRAAKGGGSVYYDASTGKWVASVTITGEDGKPRRRKMSTRIGAGDPGSREGREDAQKHLKAMNAERDKTGGLVSPRNYTTGQCLDDLLAHPPASWRSPTTLRVNRDLARRLKARLGTTLLSKLTVGAIEEHLRREVAAGMSRRTVRDQLALLRRSIRRAEKHDLASRNVAEKADMPSGAVTRKSGSMTVEQASRLLASDLDPFWKAWLSVAIMCGLRPGEVGALSWDDISDGWLRVRHSLHDQPGGKLTTGATKTEQSRRTLKLPAPVTAALAAWFAEQAEQERLAGGAWEGTGLIFTDGFGRPVNRQKIMRGFRAACKAAGVARPDGTPFQPRECRHTAASIYSAYGVSIEQIADLLGHVNSSVTREVYRHMLADKQQVTATVMDEIFGTGGQK